MYTLDRTEQLTKLEKLLHQPLNTFDVSIVRELVSALETTLAKDVKETVSDLGRGAIDLSGTGGSGISKFNTSSAAAFVVASAGVSVIKFGNGSITGKSGSMDFLSQLGINPGLSPENLNRIFTDTNLLFLSAPHCYPQMAALRDARKTLGRPSIFNFVGPLLNPARPSHRLFGISNPHMHGVINQVLLDDPDTIRALTVRAESGLDEIDPDSANNVTLMQKNVGLNQIRDFDNCFNGEDLESASGLANENATAFLSIIDGQDVSSQAFHSLIVNSAAAFLTMETVSSVSEGMRLAKKLIGSGSVKSKFESVRRKFNELA